MPILTISTNVSKASISAQSALTLSKLVAKLTGKPESYVNVVINADAIVTFGGSGDPAAYAELGSIGGFRNVNNIAKELAAAISTELKVPKDRFYIKFSDVPADELAHRGQTFG